MLADLNAMSVPVQVAAAYVVRMACWLIVVAVWMRS